MPGTRPADARVSMSMTPADTTDGLMVAVNERGKVSQSSAGVTSRGEVAGLTILKPEGAQVRAAYLATATTGFTGTPMTQPVRLADQDVPMTGEIPSGIDSYNYLADVTDLVADTLDAAAPGLAVLTYQEPVGWLVDGSILTVIWDDPNVEIDQSVAILYGALKTSGDTYTLRLASPIDTADPVTTMEMSLGISFSAQAGGVQQYSTVEVNGQRLTTAAGGEDDGATANGALITVGGLGDRPGNPDDPFATPREPRSDDERYDLLPYVEDGDTDITVTTQNPSADDNIFLATFTMNPPATVDIGDELVYVALGDSYQSGEGAAADIRPASRYLSEGYENGSNFPLAAGAQENTYTARFGSHLDPNGCHRALRNYAKINRDLLAPGLPVLLVDRTCSGAEIDAGSKPPIVGPIGGGIAANSQVQTALDTLEGQGLSGADVGLVTVGMGGNDARFSDIVAACVGPALIESLLARYPNAPGEINWIAQQATCSRVDGWFLKTGDALTTLAAAEQFGQEQISGAFPFARVMQVNYPGVLPAGDSPAWCGGLRAKDIDYARQRITDINARIDQAAASTGTEVVDIESSFGPNALCPGHSGDQLAIGIDKDNFDTEVTRLLNLDGTGDAVARQKLDALVEEYADAKTCYAQHYVPFGATCDVDAANQRVIESAQDLLAYLQTQQNAIFGNIMSPPGTSDDSVQVAFDRSRGLFHPNAAGFETMACEVLTQYRGTSGCAAPSTPTAPPAGADGNPLETFFEDLLRVIVRNFAPRTPVRLTLFSTPTDLGEVTADADGVVDTTVVVPDLNPGIHRLQLSGEGADGSQLVQEILLRVDGRPTGSYTTYLTGFETRPTSPTPDVPIEHVTVTVNGAPVGEFQVDVHGGVLVSVPSVEMLARGTLVIEATSQLTGSTVSETVSPVTSRPALWAAATAPDALTITGARFSAQGLVHSEGSLALRGAHTELVGGVEHAGALETRGRITVDPAPSQVTAGQGGPRAATVAQYRPGGASAGSSNYRAVPETDCVDGVWTPPEAGSVTGVVYVPCAVDLRQAGTYAGTIAAEGDVTVRGNGIRVGRGTAAHGEPAVVSGGDVVLTASDAAILGQLVAAGGLDVHGARSELSCGAVADTIRVSGADVSVTVGEWCLSR
ncbi:hypothetical protein [Ornithinimicrobium pekingense]|uniref:hypothetical protein n=1 Tax=Ornithinimicrobium pekingense TaxID=384677 RepID=UPI00146EC618|nr:hypothetical protein [Ornithinimicrobium pekingense]